MYPDFTQINDKEHPHTCLFAVSLFIVSKDVIVKTSNRNWIEMPVSFPGIVKLTVTF